MVVFYLLGNVEKFSREGGAMKNKEIRELIAHRRVRFYEVANALNISAETFSRWLRWELPDDKREKVIKAIKSIRLAS